MLDETNNKVFVTGISGIDGSGGLIIASFDGVNGDLYKAGQFPEAGELSVGGSLLATGAYGQTLIYLATGVSGDGGGGTSAVFQTRKMGVVHPDFQVVNLSGPANGLAIYDQLSPFNL
ncbi:MAG: hypothetical protein GWO08_17250, partial [Gammaproteobacteria bacterium]|nr:hypothetical protein [Gammaproteobacteria bacterium]NIR95330.1 hypothetical protein [Gammaproteobacteria bacterium]